MRGSFNTQMLGRAGSSGYSCDCLKIIGYKEWTTNNPPPNKIPKFYVSCIIVDECHIEKGELAGPNHWIIWAKHWFPGLAVWGLSGTPYEKSPEDLLGYIWGMEKVKWKKDRDLQYCTAEKVKDLARRFNKLVDSDSQQDNTMKLATCL